MDDETNFSEINTELVKIEEKVDSFSRIELEKTKQENKNLINIRKNFFASTVVIIILFILGLLTWDQGRDKDSLIKRIDESVEISDQEKIELIAELNKDFYSEVTNLFLPALTLVLGFLVGRTNPD